MRKYLLVSILFLAFSISYAQMQKPVKWTYSVEEIGDNNFNLVFHAKIDKTWHLYSVYSPENGPLPLFFDFKKSDNYELVGKIKETPKPHEIYEDVFKVTVKQFEDEATFTQKIKSNSNTPFSITVFLDGQACLEDGMCVQVSEKFDLNIKPSVKKEKTEAIEKTEVAPIKEVINTKENKSENPKIEVENIEEIKDTAKIESSNKTENKTEILNSEETEKENSSEDNDTESHSLWAIILEAILWGFAAIITPCVFPMIPMTVSFFMKGNENKTKGRIMASTYGASIVFLYTVPIAIIIGITYFFGGESITAGIFNWIATHWLPNVLFFIIFLVFAASFFGAFEIILPSWLVNKSDAKADKGGFVGTFFMALTLVIVSFSCTGPIVGTIIVKSTQGAIWEPIVTMLAFSMAFALPFTLFAFFPSLMKKMPKSGGWLNSVKVVLGFLELALGLKFLSIADQTYHWGILDREIYLAFWIVIFSLLGLYLLGKLRFALDSESKYLSVPRLILAIITFTFVIYMIPGMWGAPLKALSGYLPPMERHDFNLNAIIRDNIDAAQFSTSDNKGNANLDGYVEKPKYGDILHLPHGIKGYFDYEQALEISKKTGKPIFLDFTGHGCVNCREMEANVWSNPKVLKYLKNNFIVTALYVDDKTELPEKDWYTSEDGRLVKTIGKKFANLQISKYNINAQPYYVIIDANGKQLTKKNKAYDKDVDAFIQFLEEGLKNFQH